MESRRESKNKTAWAEPSAWIYSGADWSLSNRPIAASTASKTGKEEAGESTLHRIQFEIACFSLHLGFLLHHVCSSYSQSLKSVTYTLSTLKGFYITHHTIHLMSLTSIYVDLVTQMNSYKKWVYCAAVQICNQISIQFDFLITEREK